MKLIRCDICKKVVEQGFVVEEREESPHNGNIQWFKRDCCEDCLRTADNIRVTWG